VLEVLIVAINISYSCINLNPNDTLMQYAKMLSYWPENRIWFHMDMSTNKCMTHTSIYFQHSKKHKAKNTEIHPDKVKKWNKSTWRKNLIHEIMEKPPKVSTSFICIQHKIPQKINHSTDLKNLVLSCFNLDCLSSIRLDLWLPYESSYFSWSKRSTINHLWWCCHWPVANIF